MLVFENVLSVLTYVDFNMSEIPLFWY